MFPCVLYFPIRYYRSMYTMMDTQLFILKILKGSFMFIEDKHIGIVWLSTLEPLINIIETALL